MCLVASVRPFVCQSVCTLGLPFELFETKMKRTEKRRVIISPRCLSVAVCRLSRADAVDRLLIGVKGPKMTLECTICKLRNKNKKFSPDPSPTIYENSSSRKCSYGRF